MKNKKEEQIKFILDDFDFKKIHSVMKFLTLKWKFNKDIYKVPNIAELRNAAELCLNKVANSPDEISHFSIGGFEADKIENTLELRFVLDKVSPLNQLLNPGTKNGMARKA